LGKKISLGIEKLFFLNRIAEKNYYRSLLRAVSIFDLKTLDEIYCTCSALLQKYKGIAQYGEYGNICGCTICGGGTGKKYKNLSNFMHRRN
jgi:hypothetical protein